MIRFGAWQDVREKAVRLRNGGKVTVISHNDMVTEARVIGDHGTYMVQLFRTDPDSVRIVKWSCQCFPSGTLVTMANGTLRPIEQVVRGDLVRTHTGQVRKVKRMMTRQFEGELVGVRLAGFGETIWATPEHPWWSMSPEQSRCARCKRAAYSPTWCTHSGKEPAWVRSDQLYPGSLLAHPVPRDQSDCAPTLDMANYLEGFVEAGYTRSRGRNPCVLPEGFIQPTRFIPAARSGAMNRDFWNRTGKPLRRMVKVTPALAQVLGLYLGDGCLHRGDEVHWSFGPDERHLADHVVDTLQLELDVHAVVYPPKPSVDKRTGKLGRGTWSVVAYSAPLCRAMKDLCGELHDQKRLKSEMMEWDSATLLEVARGWQWADTTASVNRSLISQLQTIFLRNGFSSTVRLDAADRNQSPLVGTNTKAQYKLVGPWYWRWDGAGTGRWVEKLERSRGFRFMTPEAQWTAIKSIERRPYSGPVHTLSVEDDHSYQVHGIAVKNCKWGIWAWKRVRHYVGRTCSHAYALYLEARSLDYVDISDLGAWSDEPVQTVMRLEPHRKQRGPHGW